MRFWFFVIVGVLTFVYFLPGVLGTAIARVINETAPLWTVAIFVGVVMFFLSLGRGGGLGGGKKRR